MWSLGLFVGGVRCARPGFVANDPSGCDREHEDPAMRMLWHSAVVRRPFWHAIPPFTCFRYPEQPTNELYFPLVVYPAMLPSVIDIASPTERPMKIEIVVDPTRPAPPASLAARVAPAPAVATEVTRFVFTKGLPTIVL